MGFVRLSLVLSLAACCVTAPAHAAESSINLQVKKIVGEVSEDRIRAIIARLVAFGTRNTHVLPGRSGARRRAPPASGSSSNSRATARGSRFATTSGA